MHRYRLLLLILCWISALPLANAQPGRDGPLATALGTASVALQGDLWGMANPAAWNGLETPTLVFMASEGYGLQALRQGGARLVWPVNRTVLAAGATTYGDALFRETTWLLGAAGAVHPGTHRPVDLGMRLTLHQVAIAGYGGALAFGVSLGWQVDLGPNVRLGASAEGINHPKWNRREPLPRRLQAGLAFTPSHTPLTLVAAVRQVVFQKPDLHGGLRWSVHPGVDLLGGASGPPWRLASGISIRAGAFRLDAAAERHEALGWTPVVAVGLVRHGGT